MAGEEAGDRSVTPRHRPPGWLERAVRLGLAKHQPRTSASMAATSPQVAIEHNPDRPTPTWKLWAIGGILGVVVSVAVFYVGGDAPDTRERTQYATRMLMQVVFVVVILLGGWSRFRRR